eukprot:s739_g1.t1
MQCGANIRQAGACLQARACDLPSCGDWSEQLDPVIARVRFAPLQKLSSHSRRSHCSERMSVCSAMAVMRDRQQPCQDVLEEQPDQVESDAEDSTETSASRNQRPDLLTSLSCIAPAAQNASLQIFFKCLTLAIVVQKSQNPRVRHTVDKAEKSRPAIEKNEKIPAYPFHRHFSLESHSSSIDVIQKTCRGAKGTKAIVILLPGVHGGVGPCRQPGEVYDKDCLYAKVSKRQEPDCSSPLVVDG